MRIVIIEDEKLTAKDLSRTLTAIDPDIEIVAFLHSVEEAMVFFDAPPGIDIIFSDIELGDGLSFEVFEAKKITTPTIFCTAYNQYALNAFKTVGIDYLLKPFSTQSISQALAKYEHLKDTLSPPKNDYSDLVALLKQQVAPQAQSIIIHQGDKIIPLAIQNIALFFVEDSYTFAYTFEGKRHLLNQNMDTLEHLYSPTFFRANRQYLVHRKVVKEAAHFFNRKVLIHLTIPYKEQIIVGKLKVGAFTHWLSSN